MADENESPLVRAIAFLLVGLLSCVAGALAVYSAVVESLRLGTVFVAVVGWTIGIGSLILFRRALRTTTTRG
jgi:hypothetical protein